MENSNNNDQEGWKGHSPSNQGGWKGRNPSIHSSYQIQFQDKKQKQSEKNVNLAIEETKEDKRVAYYIETFCQNHIQIIRNGNKQLN